MLSREECSAARFALVRVRGVPSADTVRHKRICSPLSYSPSTQPWIIVLTRVALDLNSYYRRMGYMVGVAGDDEGQDGHDGHGSWLVPFQALQFCISSDCSSTS